MEECESDHEPEQCPDCTGLDQSGGRC
jgi:hypothetical protein